MPNWTRLSAPAAGAFSASWITRIGALILAVVLGGAFLDAVVFFVGPHRPRITHRGRGDRRRSRRAATQPAGTGHRDTRRAGRRRRRAEPLPSKARNLPAGTSRPPLTRRPARRCPTAPRPASSREPRTRRSSANCYALKPSNDVPDRFAPRPSPSPTDSPAGSHRQRRRPPRPSPPRRPRPAGRPTTPASSADIAQPVSLAETVAALAAMDIEQTGGFDPTSMLPLGLQQIPPTTPDPSGLGALPGAAVAQGDPSNPAIVRTPNDPPGWDRIYEGSFIEGVLVTQLNGDFPSPVLASVSVPLYSADRQRIVIPRGARVVGSASATVGQDQERLAVGFHRLIFPDGRWVSLEFRGLNQTWRGRTQRSREPPLLFDVRGRRRCRHHQRLDVARIGPVCRRASGVPGGRRARARPGRDEHPRPFPQPTADHHDPRRPPATDLADV